MKHTPLFWLRAVMAVYLLLALAYFWATPPLESSDEYKHYPVVQFVQNRGKLPVLDPVDPGRWLQAGAQPPLYYMVMATLTTPIDTSDLPAVHEINPHAFIGNPDQIRNKNLIIHDPDRSRFPGEGTMLAINLIRLASIGLGLGTLWFTYLLGKRLFSPEVGVLAAGLTAVNPMFLFVSAAVNNDSLTILLGHWGLYWLVCLWQELPNPRRRWWQYVRLGLVLGLGMLTKLSLGGLLCLTGLALAWAAWRTRRWWLLFGGGIMTLSTALAVSGWWFLRNWQVYGDLTGLNAFIAVQGTRNATLDLAGWIDEFGTLYRTFWGLFGGVNVPAPDLFYWLANLFALVATIGCIRWLWRRRTAAAVWIPLAWIGIMLLLLIRWNIISPAFQGRLIFPALGAINLLWVMGLREGLLPMAQNRLRLSLTAIAGFGLAALLLPWLAIRPAYGFPPVLDAVPEGERFGPVTFFADDATLQLVGAAMSPEQTVGAGEGYVSLVLYWQAETAVPHDYLSSVHLLGRDLESVGAINRYPGWGMTPTSRWQPGDIYRDEYLLRAGRDAAAPAQLRLSVSLYNPANSAPLPAFDPDGAPLDLLLVGPPARLAGDEGAEPAYSLPADFAEGISLAGYDLEEATAVPGRPFTITLHWRAAAAPAADYTVFVQLLDETGRQIAGADAPPVNNFYPTSLWREGDAVDDAHVMPIPANLASGTYTVLVGLYDPVSGARLARTDQPGDSISFTLTVEER